MNIPSQIHTETQEAPVEACIYAAAWFDSRGFIRIGCQKGRTPRMTVHIQTGLHKPDFLSAWWGGKSFTINRGAYLGKGQAVRGRYSWSVDKFPAQKFLQDLALHTKLRGELIDRSLMFLHRVRVLNEKANPDLMQLVNEIRELSHVKSNG